MPYYDPKLTAPPTVRSMMDLIALLVTVPIYAAIKAYYNLAGRRSDGELRASHFLEDPPRSAPHGWRDPWAPERRRSWHGADADAGMGMGTGADLLRKTNTWCPGAVIIGRWQQQGSTGSGRDEWSVDIEAGRRTYFETGDGSEEVVLEPLPELGITEDSQALRTAVGHGGGGQEAAPQPVPPSDTIIQSENVSYSISQDEIPRCEQAGNHTAPLLQRSHEELACIADSIALRIDDRTNTVDHGRGRGGGVPESASSNRGIQAGSEMHPSSPSVISSGQHGSPTAPLLHRPNEDLSLYERNLNSHNGTTGQGGGVHQITRSNTIVAMQEPGTTRDDAEAVKHALKVAYCTIAISIAGIVTIIYGFAEGQVTQGYRLHLKICALFLLTSCLSAVILILLAAPHESTIDRTRIVTILVYTTLGSLVLAILDVSFVFLKLVVLIVEVPILLLLVIFMIYLRSRTTTIS